MVILMDENIKKLVKYSYLNMYSHVLIAALDLNLFSNLKDFKTSSQIAKMMDLHEDNTKYFLNALYSMDFITKNDDKYKNTNATSKYLIEDSPYYMGNLIKIFSKLNDFSNVDIQNLVKNGPDENFQSGDDVSFEEFYNELKDSETGIRQVEIIDIVKNLEEYPKIKNILDLGCGAGLLGLAVVASREDITATLFDMPPMASLIEECISENNLEDRAEIKLGDYKTDDIGSNYDLIFAINTLSLAKSDMESIIKKIHDSLNDGGVFIAISDEVESDFSKPKEIIVSWLPYVLNGMNYYLIKDHVRNIALDVGFEEIKVEERFLSSGPMRINIFKK